MKYTTIIFLSIYLTACKNDSAKNIEIEPKTATIEDYFRNFQIPNDSTRYETIPTKNSTDNIELINNLKMELKKAGFTLTAKKENKDWEYTNCDENKIFVVNGDGVRKYFAKSKNPERNSKFYADFVIMVYEFSTPLIASQNFTLLDKALQSGGGFCNGKAPEKLVLNNNEIFHLSTSAEMFRTYIEKYGEIIKNYR